MGRERSRRAASGGAYLGLLVLLVLCRGVACAQTPGPTQDGAGDTPPQNIPDTTRMVRLSLVSGAVSVSREDSTGADPAQPNMPLPPGARLETGGDGQAEIEFEDGSVLRLAPATTVSITRLTRDPGGSFATTVAVGRGLVYAELRSAPQYAYRIETSTDGIVPVTNVTVRVNADSSPAVISVMEGAVRVERMASAGFVTDLRAGQSLMDNKSDPARAQILDQVPEESWDRWNEERDQAAADQTASRTAARDSFAGEQGYGWSDLDANGSWYDVPGQGQIWQPAVADTPGFDPYTNGSWIWYAGTGYIWSSAYAWGWTPFHCGSWGFWRGFGWGWRPAGGCGGFGWRRGSSGINIAQGPPHYRTPLSPGLPGASRPHPVVTVHGQPIPARPVAYSRSPRIFGGQLVQPLRPVGAGYTPRGGSAVGASLRRDFPIDRSSRQPIVGVLPSGDGPVRPTASTDPWRPLRHGPVRPAEGSTGVPANGVFAPGQTAGEMSAPGPAGTGYSRRQPWAGDTTGRRPSSTRGADPQAIPAPQRTPWQPGSVGEDAAGRSQPGRGAWPGRIGPPPSAPVPSQPTQSSRPAPPSPASMSRPAPPPSMPQPMQHSVPSPPPPSSPARSGAHVQPSAR